MPQEGTSYGAEAARLETVQLWGGNTLPRCRKPLHNGSHHVAKGLLQDQRAAESRSFS